MMKVYHLPCIIFLFIVSDVVRCKPDYLYNAEVGGWLKLHRIPATWQSAFLRCHYEGAVLASPLNTQLATALHTLRTQSGVKDIFLGTHQLFSNGDFVSAEGVPLHEFDIGVSHDYNITDGDCLSFSSNINQYLFQSSPCDVRLPYVCYRKLDNLTMNQCGTFDNGYQFKQYTGSCYKAHYEKQTWFTAYRICAAEGGHLVVLDDREEARIVMAMFPLKTGEVNEWEQFQIGLRAWGDSRTWITINGKKIKDVFHDWHPVQPDNAGGHQTHGTLLIGGKLDDGDPITKAMFVCEKSPDSVRFETPPPVFDERLQ